MPNVIVGSVDNSLPLPAAAKRKKSIFKKQRPYSHGNKTRNQEETNQFEFDCFKNKFYTTLNKQKI